MYPIGSTVYLEKYDTPLEIGYEFDKFMYISPVLNVSTLIETSTFSLSYGKVSSGKETSKFSFYSVIFLR